MVASQTRNKYTRRMLEKVAEEVGAGYSLAQSFEEQRPLYLPATFIETVRARGVRHARVVLRPPAPVLRTHRKTRAKIISTDDLSRDGHCGRHHRVYHHHRRRRADLYRRLCRPRRGRAAGRDEGADGRERLFSTAGGGLLPLIGAALVIAYLAFKRTERGKLVLASYAIERAPAAAAAAA